MNEYKLCSVCDKPLPEGLASLALRQFERKTCSDDCRKTEDIRHGRLCCNKAEYTACVCARSYKCPEHGEVHVGSHD